jgi:hypothetical protein
VKIIK